MFLSIYFHTINLISRVIGNTIVKKYDMHKTFITHDTLVVSISYSCHNRSYSAVSMSYFMIPVFTITQFLKWVISIVSSLVTS